MSELLLKVLQTTNLPDFVTSLRASNCKACALGECYETNKPVVSRGNISAKIMLVGEAPGETEAEKGIPFTGRAGRLLDELLASIGIYTERDCYITNVSRCRPFANRTPTVAEAQVCVPYLKHEISLLKPKAIVCLGKTASQNLLPFVKSSHQMKQLAGTFHKNVEGFNESTFMITYHPAFLLRPGGQQFQKDFVSHFLELAQQFDILPKKTTAIAKEPFSISPPERINKSIWT